MKLFSVLASVATFAAVALGSSHVVDLTPDNFDSVVGAGKPALVEFFAVSHLLYRFYVSMGVLDADNVLVLAMVWPLQEPCPNLRATR
jgi:hypothetical protein